MRKAPTVFLLFTCLSLGADADTPASANSAERLAPYIEALPAPSSAAVLDQPRMSHDGRGVYAISDEGSEFRQLRYLPLEADAKKDRAVKPLSSAISWDVEAFALSGDGRYLLYVTNEDGCSRLNLRDVRNGLDLRAPVLPLGRVMDLQFSADNARVALTLETTRAAREVWTYDIGASRLDPPAPAATTGLDPSKFVDPLLVRYPTFDSANGAVRQIPTLVYRPPGAGPFPVLIRFDGGPDSQHRPGFDPFTQFAVAELGMVVIAPNVRGSDGYGKSYRALDDGLQREDAIKDVGALLVWIGQHVELDRSRVIVMGEGYGGFLSLAALMYFGDRLLGGVEAGGPTNLLAFMQRAPEESREALRGEYGDERDPQVQSYLARLSPLQNSQRIDKPLLVADSSAEAEQMIAAIRGRGIRVEQLKTPSREATARAAAAFIAELLAPAKPAPIK